MALFPVRAIWRRSKFLLTPGSQALQIRLAPRSSDPAIADRRPFSKTAERERYEDGHRRGEALKADGLSALGVVGIGGTACS
jgi:hypothetical protein